MSSSSGDGGSRVSIPADLLVIIQNIREVTGKQHSDEDIFSLFKECFNDPHETIQKLIYLDTFHEVKSKRERKKENSVPNTKGRGRTGRRNFASSYTDASNGTSAAFKKQSGANHIIGGSRTTLPAPNKAICDTKPSSIKAPNLVTPPSRISDHKIQDSFISPVNKGVAKEQPLSKSTSLSEDVVELDKSEASTVPIVVSDSVVETGTQYVVDGTSQISEQSSPIVTSNCSSQSEKAIESEAAANKDKNKSLLKSDVGERPHVIFPVHLQVAKVLESGLTFGSFDSNFVREASSDSNSESSHGTVAYGTPARKDISTFSQDKDHVISNSASQNELTLQPDQTLLPVGGSERDKLKEFLSITDTHQIGYVQKVPYKSANCDAPPISYPDQYSIAASQQAIHRQQYPLNFFPYGPYFPPFYLPQPYIPQFMSPNGFQQQSYLPPRDDAPAPPGAKFPLAHIKSGGDIGNSPPTTIPSPYDSYAFNHIPSVATINSTHIEEKKENIYTTGPLSVANLQASPMYNLSLQGHPLAFPTMQAGFTGIYQQTQPVQAAPTLSAMTEPVGLSHITNQLPQAALTNLENNYLVKESY